MKKLLKILAVVFAVLLVVFLIGFFGFAPGYIADSKNQVILNRRIRFRKKPEFCTKNFWSPICTPIR